MRLSKISNNQKVTQFRMQYRDRTSSAWLVKVKLNLLVIVSRLSYYWSIIRISNTTGGHNFSLELAQDAFYCSSCFDTNVP